MRDLKVVKYLAPLPYFYLGILLLALPFLLITACDLITNSDDGNFDLSKTSGFKVSIPPGGLQDDDFFPLQVGAKWHYELVHAVADTSRERFGYPKDFSVIVSNTLTVDGEKYYVVENYFFPGPELPNPALMRREGARIYVRIEEKEYLLYSFAPEDTLWSLPLYVNPTLLYPRKAKRSVFTEKAAAVTWDLNGFPGLNPVPGRTESGWADVFNPGLGRVRIFSVSQAYSTTVWDLIRIE